MSYYDRNVYGADVDMPTREDLELEWAGRIGYEDGASGGVGEEGKHALAGDYRDEYIHQYREGFLARKFYDGVITEAEWHFYDPFPGRWGRYYEAVGA